MAAADSIEEHVEALAANLPSGRVWVPKFARGSNLNGLLRGIAPTFRQIDDFLQRYVAENPPTASETYLAEWEAALGIPDPCIPLATDVATRQRNVEIKLAVLSGVQTKADFEFVGQLFGLTIEVNPGIEHVAVVDGGLGTKLPVLDIPADIASVDEARATIVVVETLPAVTQFDYDWPVQFSTGEQIQMRCLLETLKPAHCQMLYVTGP